MTHVSKRNDGLLLIEILNEKFQKELNLVLELISSHKKNLPDVASYEENKAILKETVNLTSLNGNQLISSLKENLVNIF